MTTLTDHPHGATVTEGVDWRGGCGHCVHGWVLTVHGDHDVTYEECPCATTPTDEPFPSDPDWDTPPVVQ